MDIGAQYQNYVQQSELSNHSKRSYLSRFDCFRNYLQQAGAPLQLNQLDSTPTEKIRSLLEQYQSHLHDDRLLEGSSANRYVTQARHFLSFLGVTPPSVPRSKERTPEPTVLSPQEQSDLLEALSTHASNRDRALVKFMLLAALRPAECVSLRWLDLFYRDDQMYLRIRAAKERTQPHDDSARKFFREVALPVSLEDDILSLFDEKKGHAEFESLFSAQLIFVTRDGKPLSANALDRIARSNAHRAGINTSCSTLRNTCIANWLKPQDPFKVAAMSGASLELLQKHATSGARLDRWSSANRHASTRSQPIT